MITLTLWMGNRRLTGVQSRVQGSKGRMCCREFESGRFCWGNTAGRGRKGGCERFNERENKRKKKTESVCTCVRERGRENQRERGES